MKMMNVNDGKRGRGSLLVLVTGVFLLLGGVMALAQRPDAEMGRFSILDMPGKWWKHPRIVEDLKLTPEQTKKIDDIFFQHSRKLVDVKARLEKGIIDLQQLTDGDTFTREQALKLLDEIAVNRAELAKATMIMQLDIREVLTPEQRAELKKLRAQFRERARERTTEEGALPRQGPGRRRQMP